MSSELEGGALCDSDLSLVVLPCSVVRRCTRKRAVTYRKRRVILGWVRTLLPVPASLAASAPHPGCPGAVIRGALLPFPTLEVPAPDVPFRLLLPVSPLAASAPELLLWGRQAKSGGHAANDFGDVAELVVAGETAAVGARLPAGGALAVGVLDVLPDALLAKGVLARRAARVGEKVETNGTRRLQDQIAHGGLHLLPRPGETRMAARHGVAALLFAGRHRPAPGWKEPFFKIARERAERQSSGPSSAWMRAGKVLLVVSLLQLLSLTAGFVVNTGAGAAPRVLVGPSVACPVLAASRRLEPCRRRAPARRAVGDATMLLDSAAGVVGAVFLTRGVDSLFRLTLRGVSPVAAAAASAQLAVATLLLGQGFTPTTSAACAVVVAALVQGVDKAGPGGGDSRQQSLEGKTVWITGASSGIGEALAYACYAAGAHVILSARRTSELERVRDHCLKSLEHGSDSDYSIVQKPPLIVPLDLSKPGEMESAFSAVCEGLGQDAAGVDVLVHNGGVSTRALAQDMPWEIDESVLKVNYLGPVALTKAVLPDMLARQKGHIVVISSVQGIIGLPGRTAYSASKHALHGFFDGLRAEVAARGVSVSLLCPGYVRTSLSLNAVDARGGKYGQMDETTAKGMPPEKFAAQALEAIARRDAQIVIADDTSAFVGVYLKWLCPHVLEWVMRKRAKKAAAAGSG